MASLESLLDAAAEALLSGDLDALSRLTPDLESAVVPTGDQAVAARLLAKARRNARLLQAATRGVKAARMRMNEIKHGPTLTTYDARGQKALIAMGGGEPARRV